MSKVVCLSTSKIKPSQDFLKEDTIKLILKNYFENRRDLFPSIPLVRFDYETNDYVVIDGHNLVAVYDLIGEDIDVFVVENSEEYLDDKNSSNSNKESLNDRNAELRKKFDLTLNEAKIVESEGIKSFKDLRDRYPYLKSVEMAKKFYLK